MNTEQPVILLLENDTADVFMFRRTLLRLGYQGVIKVVSSVAEAITYLEHSGSHRNPEHSPRPDLIVCDLKLASSTGTELLHWIRAQRTFRSIPVVMLSGTSLPPDRVKARELGARDFFLKSSEINEMTERMRKLLTYLPGADRQGALDHQEGPELRILED